jgi:hypothetical protein
MSKGNSNVFSTFWEFKKRFGPIRQSGVSSRRMALVTENLPSGRLKKRLWWRRWRDVCRCRFAMRTNFVLPGHREMWLSRSRLSDVLSRRMGLRNHNLPFWRLHKRLWWNRWSDNSRCRKTMTTHFLHPGHQKKRLGRSRLSDDLSRRMGLTTHNLPSGRLNKRLWWIRWSCGSRCRKPYKLIFCILSIEKKTWKCGLSRRMGLTTHNLLSGRLKKRLGWSRWSDVSRCR